ncbi:hypothetical protein [Brevibacillus laterosporus]|uniref:hypothetical protein n=1 Tax=Brevibacillus laterosporus TaxID=1465 RepID=UPI000EB37D10|nr:hypothetical protein [Brevibacillus laterosporus]AYK05308.1 hypothetical protein D8Z77_02125 [Brevibacillus laterosporus]
MVNLTKIEKLNEMTKYEDPRTSEIHHGGKKWTRGVPIILVDEYKQMIVTNHWVYNKTKNLCCQGSEFYDIGKSHIKEIYIVQAI